MTRCDTFRGIVCAVHSAADTASRGAAIMVMANPERAAKALDLLRDGLGPPCEATWRGFHGGGVACG